MKRLAVSTLQFERWLDRLSDMRGRARILARIERLLDGNAGDVAPIGHGLSELRIDVGPGYRVYCLLVDPSRVVLLCGGTKSSQQSDIRRAQALAESLERSEGDPQ